MFDTPFRISKHGNLVGVFSSVSLAVNLGVATFSMLERLVVGVKEESRLIPQMNCQEFFLNYLKGNIPDMPDIPLLRR